MLKEAYNKLDPRTAEKKVEIVKTNLELLYKEYSSSLQKFLPDFQEKLYMSF